MNKPGTYLIKYLEIVHENHILRISVPDRKIIKEAIEKKLVFDPIKFGKPLRFTLKGYRRLRVGDYRVVYRIHQDREEVIIVAIMHRKDIYK